MPSLKSIRKRISSVKSTQKITRAMKMVAGARLNKAQQRITELRPYAVKTQEVLSALMRERQAKDEGDEVQTDVVVDVAPEPSQEAAGEDVLVERKLPLPRQLRAWLEGWKERRGPEKRVLLVVLTSDRGLCGAFNTNINKRAEREWKQRVEQGQEVKMILIGRKGRDYLTRRNAPVLEYLPGVWDKLSFETAQSVGKKIITPLVAKDVDAIYLVYNEFKSAMSQLVTVEPLLPVATPPAAPVAEGEAPAAVELIYEPDKDALLEALVPMYVDISILRALYESQASELGARMTAMDAATKNAKEMIAALTLQYNKARQAAITKELMEIIGGSEALKE